MFRSMLKKLTWVGHLGVAVGLLYYVLRHLVNKDEFLEIAGQINWVWLIPIGILTFFGKWSIATQTRIGLLHYNISLSNWSILKIQFRATLFSFLFAGDFVGGGLTWYYFTKENKQRAQVASLLFFLRLVNLITIIPFGFIGFIIHPQLSKSAKAVFVLVSAINIIIILPFMVPVFARICTRLLMVVAEWFRWKRVKIAITNFSYAIEHGATIPLKESFGIWGNSVLAHLLGLLSLQIVCSMADISVSIIALVLIRSLLLIITSLPLILGGTGVRELSLVSILQTMYSIDTSRSAVLSLLMLATMVLFNAMPGAILLFPTFDRLGKKNFKTWLNNK